MVDLEAVHGIQKVAAFLLSLEREKAAALLKKMPPKVVERVAEAMTSLDPKLAQDGVADQLVRELARSLHKPKGVRAADREQLEGLLTGAMGDQGASIVSGLEERRREKDPFLELEAFAPGELASVLRTESPPVAALTLAHLPPAFAAKVLSFFGPEEAQEVVRRIAKLDLPNPAVLRGIADDIASRVSALPPLPPSADPAARLKSIAEILNNSSSEIEKGSIESIGEEDPEMASELREYMFTWDDLAGIGKRDMQKILGTVDTKTLAVALKGCPAEVEDNVLGNLSSRVRDMVTEERDIAGPMAMSDVQSSRNEILVGIRAMIETGELKLTRGGEELVE